eukprot:XP_017949508.1 PREDICTED: triadin-like [Xenopus tropicalis]
MNNLTIQQNDGAVNEIKNDLKYTIPVIVTLSMLLFPVLGAIAWLVYVKIMQKKHPANDIENPPVTAQSEKDSPTPENTDSFFRCLFKKLKQKMRKKKPVTDVENPPEIAQSEQKLTGATSSDRSVKKKIKKKKKKPPATADKGPDRRKLGEITEESKAHIESLPEPESDALLPINTFSFLESLMPLHEASSKNQKHKKVQHSIKLEEIIDNKEDTEGLMKQLMALQNKSPTANNLKISVHYERIEETDSKEEDAPPLQIEMETTSIPLQTSEPSEPERIEKSAETETAPSKGSLPKPESEACLPPSALSFLEQLKASFRKPSGNRKRKKVQRTMMIEEIISDEEDTAEYTEVFLKQLKDVCNESPTAYDPKIEVQILQIEPNENICSESELQSVTSLEQSSELKR